MLHEFLSANQQELVSRCQAKVAQRPAPLPTDMELQYGIPLFLGQLIDTLRAEQGAEMKATSDQLLSAIGSSAGKHGNELLRKGFTIDQVIHDYGDLCQAVTELAWEKKAPITVTEFHIFNRCLDNAMAGAVAEFGLQREQLVAAEGTQTMNERLGFLAHEQRNLLNSAMLAFEVIKGGNVTVTGATGAVLQRSLIGLRDLIDRTLADVRLAAGMKVRQEPILIRELLAELQISATMEAKAKERTFTIAPVAEELAVYADRPMLCSAISNLLQNAFKFTRPLGHVLLTAHAVSERVLIEIEDECGGLPQGDTEALFQPFEQRSSDRTGLGLGLSISRRNIEANGGKLRVCNLPGKGCIFTIDLPRPALT